MENTEQPIEVLQDIRQMMKQSSRFLSLSGLSGVFAGVYALAGTIMGWMSINAHLYYTIQTNIINRERIVQECAIICGVVLLLSLATAWIFSKRKAHRSGHKLMDHTAWRMVINMLIPLASGGIFCIALIMYGDMVVLVAPVMLIFYGLALVNTSKYTVRDIRALGCLEIGLGLVASFYPANGLLFWALGFGVLHIIYGTVMWYKYDRNASASSKKI